MHSTRAAIAIILAAVCSTPVATSCASSRAGDDGSVTRPSRPQRRDGSVITRDELTTSAARDALHAIEVLRPAWLQVRATGSIAIAPPEIVVYLDGQRLGNKGLLAQFPVTGITELRHYSSTDATQRWGTGHAGGVIEIVTR